MAHICLSGMMLELTEDDFALHHCYVNPVSLMQANVELLYCFQII